MKLKHKDDVKAEVDMTPMIDCVFLLLVFFMVSTTFNKQEADISFALPGTAEQSDAVEIPDEQIIQITEAGNVFLNDLEYDAPTDPDMPELVKTLDPLPPDGRGQQGPRHDHHRPRRQRQAAARRRRPQRLHRRQDRQRHLRRRLRRRGDLMGRKITSEYSMPKFQYPISKAGKTTLVRESEYNLEDRLIDFAVRIIRLSEALPNNKAGTHVASQVLRSGTSPAPNYGEAQSAESAADFIHKLKIALKELRETLVWLAIISRAKMINPHPCWLL
jgi:four helix bundle protein